MKNLFTLILSLFSLLSFSQVINDDCAGTVNLGTAPLCQGTVFSNIGATPSEIGSNNNPDCFTESPASDVWFSFLVAEDITDYTIEINGVDDNGNPLQNIQAAVYRGFCPDNIFGLNTCATSAFGSETLSFDVNDLTPNDLYFIRIDNFNGSISNGDFTVCINEQDEEFNITQDGSTKCSGVLYDSGGPNGDYGINEDNIFTICPGVTNQCITLNFEYFNIEQGDFGLNGDVITFYDGDDTNALVITQISGSGLNGVNGNGSVCYTVYAQNCLTIRMETDDEVNFEGFKATWECSNSACVLPEPITIDSSITEKTIINNLSSSLVDITVNSIECENGAIAAFKAGDNTNLGLEKGILLTTGLASTAVGPNLLDGAGFPHITNGDPDLDALSELLGSDLLSNDACIIEVEAFVNTNELNFQFLFGSEEYPEYETSEFNDIFALFIEGEGIEGVPELGGKKNLALLPGSNIPIQINSVNSQSNWEYFRNNQKGQSSEYDGFVVDYLGSSKSLTATAKVVPCNTYKLKFAIADRVDFIFDSGVFISELTNSVPEISLATSYGFDYLLEKCSDGQEQLVIQLANPQDQDLKFAPVISGTATNGVDYTLDLPDTIVFEAGQSLITFPITILSDNITEGSETVEILFQNDFGCGIKDIASFTFEIREEIDVVVQGGEDMVYICPGIEYQLFAEGATDYVWTPSSGLNDANIENPIILNPQQSQTYIVTGTIDPFTNPECIDSDTITVIPVEPNISIETNDPLQICFGDSISVELINNTGNSNISWENPGLGVINPDSNFTVIKPTVFSADEEIIYVAKITLNGCEATDTLKLQVDPFAFPEILVQDSLVCEGYQIQLASGEDDGFTSFLWTPSDYLNSDSIPNPIATATEDITYKLVAESNNGICIDSAEINITIQESSIEIGSPDTVLLCLGDSISFTTMGTSNGLNLSWEPSDIIDLPNSPNVTVKPLVSQYAIVTMDFDGCISMDSVWMQVDSLPSMEFEVIQDKSEYCIGEVFTIVSPGYNEDHFPNIMFNWDPAPGIISELDKWNLAVIAADTATFKRITTNGACRDSIVKEIIVLDPSMEIMVADTSILCPFTPVQLTIQSESQLEEIMWEPGSPDLSCDDCENPIATVGVTTEFTVSAMADGCPISASATVKVADLFLAIGFATPVVCPGTPVQLNLQSNGDISDINWSPNNAVSCDDCPNPIGTVDETTTFEVSAKVDGCDISTANVLTIDDNIRSTEIVVTPGEIVPVGGEITITVLAQPSFGPNTTYEWFIEGNSQGEGGPIFSTNQDIEGPTLYRVFIVDDNGCFWEGIITVIGSVPEFRLPNAFTPFNNDEINDVFRLVQTDSGKLDNWELNSFDIFNRWGERVFNCEDKQCALEEGWNGRINNTNAPGGVYIYAIELELGNGDKVAFRGDVTLLR